MDQTVLDTIKFVHILGAIGWVGGGLMMHALFMIVTGTKDADATGKMLDWSNTLGQFFFAPLSVLTLLAGVALIAMGSDIYSFTAPFVHIGFGGFFASMILSMPLMMPKARQWRAALAEHGDVNHPAAAAPAKAVLVLTSLDTLILIVVVWAMVVKPGGIA